MLLANVGGTTGVPLVPVTDEGLFIFLDEFSRKEYLSCFGPGGTPDEIGQAQ